MADITLYTTGTLTFTNGSPIVTGVGTLLAGLMAGDLVLAPNGVWYELGETPTGNLEAVLSVNYAGTTALAAVGGSAWWIFKASISRDSVRTATRQLTDITSLYRRVVNLTNSDQTVRLSKASVSDRAGMILQKDGLDLLQAGTFEDDDFAIRYLVATTWTKALGVNPTSGAVSIYSQLLLGNTITPPALTATTSNYAPVGVDKASVIRVSANSNWALTGLAGGVDGRIVAILNVGNHVVDLEHDGGISLAANRFELTGDTAIAPNASALLIYDGASSRWRQFGGSGAGAVSSGGDRGWSPILSYVSGGAGRIVAQITDWTGGEGAKPSIGAYIGATGLVTLAADAVSIVGPKGDQIQFRLDTVLRNIQWSYVDTIEWVDLISFADITGPPVATEWIFSTGITDVDPGATKVAFNHATFASISYIYINKLERSTRDLSAWLVTLDDSSSLPNRGVVSFQETLDPTKFAIFMITGDIVTSGNYFKIPVTPTSGVIPTNGNRLSLQFFRTGDKGISGLIPRGAYSALTSYLVGDVTDLDGSSYISLVQPNLGNAPAFEADNAYWALFARGVNAAFVTAINLTLTNATAQATNSAASAVLAQSYAITINAFAAGTDNSSKAWAIGGTDNGQPTAGDAKSWAIKISANVDGTEFSAKEYAGGAQAATGGSAKNWASQIGADVTGAAINSRSAKSWAQEALIGATLGGSARDWSVTTSAAVDGISFSSKEYAQGSQGFTGGSAMNWASQVGFDVTGAALNSRSAKSWAQENIVGATLGGSAKDWASYIGGAVNGVLYSARQYALDAAASLATSLTLEASTATSAGSATSSAASALSSATTATAQANIATAKAVLTAADAVTATAKATDATASAALALTYKNDAASSATAASGSSSGAATSASNAAGSATAAQGYAAILASPDYGFFVDAPTSTRDYGLFV